MFQTAIAASAPAVTAPGPGITASEPTPGDELPNPLEKKRRALRTEAIADVISGKATPVKRGKSTVVKVGETVSAQAKGSAKSPTVRSQYVELSREATDRIFVVLAEFGNQRHPDYPDQDTDPTTPGPATFRGPLNNAIPAPDRATDNSTVWQPNYDRSHYEDIYFGKHVSPGSGKDVESVKQYYQRQSSGRYSVAGTVTDWVKVRYNEARYGRSNGYPCGGVVCSNTWNLVQDSVNQWVKDQKAMGRTQKQIKDELKTFDVWDRYDYDGDGNFNEPDGYIDHFQVVHAGGDQADGDPQQGEDAIWSHRWYAFVTNAGFDGPSTNPLGGTQIGNTGLWVGDYTIQPENGGVSVFTHEYGHDLGLPDLYETQGGQNGVDFWSLMAQSRLSGPQDQGIGTRAGDLGAWEKLQLGWLDYAVVAPSAAGETLNLGPHEFNSDHAQGAVVVLPKKEVTTSLVDPYAGSSSWWSGSGDDLNNTMTRQVALPAGAAELSMQVNYDVELDFDYVYVEVNDGSGWATIPGSITDPSANNGIGGSTDGEWVPATFDLSDYAGQTIGLRLRYATDGGLALIGFFADDITVTSGATEVFTSGAESGTEGWTLDGFSAAEASFTRLYDNYYLASHRDYQSFDKYLKSGPYNFGWANSRPDYVEHFPLQDGLLISYWDTSFIDNDTSVHPGQGEILPIDANPRPYVRLDGGLWRERIQMYDATFSLEKSDSVRLHFNGQETLLRGQPAQPLFKDNVAYWTAAQPTKSVKVPNNGVNIKVVGQNDTTMKIKVWLR